MSYRTLYIESSKRSSGTSSDFKVKMKRNVSKGDCYELAYAHIPITCYTIDGINNTFVFNEGGSNLTATLLQGYYTNSTILTELQARMNAVGALTYTVSFSNLTQKITISATGPFSIRMSGINSPLGFTADTPSAASHSATSLLSLDRLDALHIDINEVIEIEGSNFGTTFVIPNDVNTLQVLEHSPETKFHQRITFTNDTNLFSIRIKDSNNQTINLQGVEWFMILKHCD